MHRTHNPTNSAADTDNGAVVTPADILRGAALYLEAHGWHRGSYYDTTTNDAFPSACADGAIGMAAYGRKAGFPGETDNPDYRHYNRARDVLTGHLIDADEIGPGDCDDANVQPADIFAWNDADGQTRDNVIATLRAAADDWTYAHATEDDLETYADTCAWNETQPTREGFLAWLGAR
jgi:hypothetical protein